MTQQLYLLRHAEAEPWNPLGNDFSRSLTPVGSKHASLVSTWASESLHSPDTILCSPAKRTRETLAPFLAHWSRLLESTEYAESMYGASLDMLLTLAEDAFSFSERILMIGHNPGVMNLLHGVLQPEQAADINSMGPGTLAVIEFSAGFKRQAQTGNLLHLVR
ncbi:MAG: histidine phosphatase family protein [Lysobacterales bacterium]